MIEGGFCSPRSDTFPAGLRVLVVDDDMAWLKILEKMLKRCNYEVTTCFLAREALKLLRERKDGYDIVISDVNMPDMDGFKLLEHVGLEMDLPVIMMSVDGETSRVMKGVQHGACDYLLKPIGMKELRNIWQHVVRKRIHEVREIEGIDIDGIRIPRNGIDQLDEGHWLGNEDTSPMKKRKDFESKHDGRDLNDAACTKKARVVWSVELHQKFVNAVNQIGIDKVGPKRILDLMNVPWLTRENVASHLQKYRLYLSRLPKEQEQAPSHSGSKASASPSKDTARSSSPMNSTKVHRGNEAENNSYPLSGRHSVVPNVNLNGSEVDLKDRMVAANVTSPSRRQNKQLRFDHSNEPLGPKRHFPESDSTNPGRYSWDLYQQFAFNQEQSFKQLALPAANHNYIHTDYIQASPSIKSETYLAENDVRASYDSSPNNLAYRPGLVSVNEFPFSRSYDRNALALEDVKAGPCGTISCLKNQDLHSNLVDCTDLVPRYFDSGTGSLYSGSLDEDLQLFLLHSSYFPVNLGMDAGLNSYLDPGFITGVPDHVFDTLKFNYEHLSDPTGCCSVVDQGLFMA